jgi:AcrR family transcriptional regulator
MPKIVDSDARRDQIAGALLRVAADRGLEAVSLRQVAAEAGVSAGMVQHYFRTKDEMLAFAMGQVVRSVGERLGAQVSDRPLDPRKFLHELLDQLLPVGEERERNAKVSLAFAAYAAVRPNHAAPILDGMSWLRNLLADALRAAEVAGTARTAVDPERAATALIALVDGLVLHVLTGGCSPALARATFESQLDVVLGPE